jgi:HAD superfamily hydrolase (TIGR01509 family)
MMTRSPCIDGAARLPRLPRPFRIEAVLFDFDGTLTEPGVLDFASLKVEVGCPVDRFVLEHVLSLEDQSGREQALAVLERFELEGAARSRSNEGAEALVHALRALGLPVGILTRNGRAAVERALENFTAVSAADFSAIVTRDDPAAAKPAPDGVLLACERMGVAPERTLLVGDYVLDVEAGRRAAAVTMLLTNGREADPLDAAETESLAATVPDFTVDRLEQVTEVVRLGLGLPEGKLPNELLGRYLDALPADDPALIVGAGVGEDVAAVDVTGDQVVVVHGDPITLTGEDLGRYAVRVNANDVATAGATPRWFLATVLLPPGASGAEALFLLGEIAEAARELGVTAVGGHTEITGAVLRPVVSGTMLGVVTREGLRDKGAACEGDRIVLTKALAVEGTALLAAELADDLRAEGIDAGSLQHARHFLERISILPEARVAAHCDGAVAMHDVTEGGLATALEELSVACGRAITVHVDRVPVYPETRALCSALGLDPLGLIGSGSLLIVCRPHAVEGLIAACEAEGIAATEIAGVGAATAGVSALEHDRPVPWPRFKTDEAARALAARRPSR